MRCGSPSRWSGSADPTSTPPTADTRSCRRPTSRSTRSSAWWRRSGTASVRGGHPGGGRAGPGVRDCKFCLRRAVEPMRDTKFFGCRPAAAWATLRGPGGPATVPDELSNAPVLIEPLSTPVHAVPPGRARTRRPERRDPRCRHHRPAHPGGRAPARRPDRRRDRRPRSGNSLSGSGPTPCTTPPARLVAAIRDDLGTSADVVFDCVAVQGTSTRRSRWPSRAAPW